MRHHGSSFLCMGSLLVTMSVRASCMPVFSRGLNALLVLPIGSMLGVVYSERNSQGFLVKTNQVFKLLVFLAATGFPGFFTQLGIGS